MDLVTRGLTNKEIAQHLGLSDGTIKQHLFAIFQRLGVSNRTWAVASWQKLTLSTVDGEPARTSRTAPSLLAPNGTNSNSILPRRLLATVAVALPQHVHSETNLVEEEPALRVLALCRRWAEVFEGNLRVSGASSLLVTFGHPRAHFDDMERALAFAEAVQTDLRCQLGIETAIAIDAALDRLHVHHGDVVLSSTAWHSIQLLSSERVGITSTDRVSHFASNFADESPLSDLWHQQLRRAPFFREVGTALAQNRASWIAIEAWPPIFVKVLLDAWRYTTVGKATRQIVLRLPSANTDAIETTLLAQFDAQAGSGDSFRYPEADLGWRLHTLAQEGPLCVLVYGMDEATALANLLDDDAIRALSTCSVVFLLSSLAVRGPARISARMLDQNGRKPLVGRVHELVLPEAIEPASQYCPDIVALLDRVDYTGWAILALVLKFQRCTSQFIARRLDLPETSLVPCLEQLQRFGLISKWPDHSIRLRDARTERTISEQLGHRA